MPPSKSIRFGSCSSPAWRSPSIPTIRRSSVSPSTGELAGLRKLGFSWPEIGGLADNAFRFAFDAAAATRNHNSQ